MKIIVMDQVCDDCKKANLEASCTHKQGELPWWQDSSRHGDLAELMTKDHLEDFLRETK